MIRRLQNPELHVLQDVRGRAEILEYYLSSKPVASDVDVMRLARATPGAGCPAHAANLCEPIALPGE
jgi:ATP-dependent Zn protease